MGELNFCLIKDILKTALEQGIMDLSLNLHLPYLYVRLLHNKFISLFYASLKCYSLYLDTGHIAQYVPFFLIPFVFLPVIFKKFRVPWIFILLTVPLLFIINPLQWDLGQRINIFRGYYCILGISGMGISIFNLVTRKNK